MAEFFRSECNRIFLAFDAIEYVRFGKDANKEQKVLVGMKSIDPQKKFFEVGYDVEYWPQLKELLSASNIMIELNDSIFVNGYTVNAFRYNEAKEEYDVYTSSGVEIGAWVKMDDPDRVFSEITKLRGLKL
ncbi:MAG: hypothetical protein CMP22_05035 [Rickettsiales bacterium]|nr:hypothetical protein [Rickettsiales bacterium]|tara:strand:- start:24 stop:416 length:393 start_codon:yes stop_codon:yes gene_type:complete